MCTCSQNVMFLDLGLVSDVFLNFVCTLNFAHELYLDVRKIMSMFAISTVPQKYYVISQKKCTSFF